MIQTTIYIRSAVVQQRDNSLAAPLNILEFGLTKKVNEIAIVCDNMKCCKYA